MSHEIRTPINAIVGMSDIAKLRAADSQPVLDCLEKIDTASRHLAALVDDVLDMSKIENDKLQLTPQIVSLHSIIFRPWIFCSRWQKKRVFFYSGR